MHPVTCRKPFALTRRLVLLLPVLLLTACGGGHEYLETVARIAPVDRTLRVAIIPMENLTNHKNAGRIASELVYSATAERNLFILVPPQAVQEAMAALKITTDDRLESRQSQEIGVATRADAVLMGSISEYGYQYGLREEPSVGLNLRLVKVGSAEVLWAASASGVGRGVFSRDSLTLVAQEVVHRLVGGLSGTARMP